MAGEDHVVRARELLGLRFRPQGRSEDGVDCLGLLLIAYRIPEASVRQDYRLRGDHREEILRGATQYFRRVPRRSARPGDALLFQVDAEQFHLGVLTSTGLIHADARLKRVVERPGRPDWPLLAVLRRRLRKRRG